MSSWPDTTLNLWWRTLTPLYMSLSYNKYDTLSGYPEVWIQIPFSLGGRLIWSRVPWFLSFVSISLTPKSLRVPILPDLGQNLVCHRLRDLQERTVVSQIPDHQVIRRRFFPGLRRDGVGMDSKWRSERVCVLPISDPYVYSQENTKDRTSG